VKWYVLNELSDVVDVNWKDEKDVVDKLFKKVARLQEASQQKGAPLKKFFENHMKPFVWTFRQDDPENSGEYCSQKLWELQQHAPWVEVAQSMLPADIEFAKDALNRSAYARVKALQLIELYVIEKLEAEHLPATKDVLPTALKDLEGVQKKCVLSIINHLCRLERGKQGAMKQRKAMLKKLRDLPPDASLIIQEQDLEGTQSLTQLKQYVEYAHDELSKVKVFKEGEGEDAFKGSFDVSIVDVYRWPTFPNRGYAFIKKSEAEGGPEAPPTIANDLEEVYELSKAGDIPTGASTVPRS
jgi:hypothetical protein